MTARESGLWVVRVGRVLHISAIHLRLRIDGELIRAAPLFLKRSIASLLLILSGPAVVFTSPTATTHTVRWRNTYDTSLLALSLDSNDLKGRHTATQRPHNVRTIRCGISGGLVRRYLGESACEAKLPATTVRQFNWKAYCIRIPVNVQRDIRGNESGPGKWPVRCSAIHTPIHDQVGAN